MARNARRVNVKCQDHAARRNTGKSSQAVSDGCILDSSRSEPIFDEEELEERGGLISVGGVSATVERKMCE
jgi:hypothetical protein